MNPSAEHADIVLPVATSWERDALSPGFQVSLEGMRRVQLRQKVVEPLGEARSDTDIVFGLSQRLGFSEGMFDCDLEKGREAILADTSISLDALRTAPEGIDVDGSVPLKAYETERVSYAGRTDPDLLGTVSGVRAGAFAQAGSREVP